MTQQPNPLYQWVNLLRNNGVKPVRVWKQVEQDIIYLSTFPEVNIWFSNLTTKTRTITCYASNFRRVCDFKQMTPTELFQYVEEGIATRDHQRLPNLLAEIGNMPMRSNKNKGRVVREFPKTHSRIAEAVRSFINWNLPDIKLGKWQYPIGDKPDVPVPLQADIAEMKSKVYNGRLRDKALIDFFCSTAVRPDTIEDLTWDMLGDTGDPEVPKYLEIDAKYMKGHAGTSKLMYLEQVTFLTKQAWESLQKYRKTINVKDTDKLFWVIGKHERKTPFARPLSGRGTWEILDALSNRIWGKQSSTQRKHYTADNFRHFVSEAIDIPTITEDTQAFIVGHLIYGTKKHYVKGKWRKILPEYKTALPYLVT